MSHGRYHLMILILFRTGIEIPVYSNDFVYFYFYLILLTFKFEIYPIPVQREVTPTDLCKADP